MNFKTVGIIGGTNGMGRWLADLLAKEGCEVHVTGRKTEMTAADAAKICEVVVVSVPIAATAEVIAEIGPLMKKEQVLMDLTSLKKEPVRQMLCHSASEVVGCHPLFGPSIAGASGQNIVLCPGRGEAGFLWMKQIFDQAGYAVLVRTPEEHDKMMSVVQALNHLNTLSLGLAIAATGISLEEVCKFSTPIFRDKMKIVRHVMAGNPEMYVDIIAGNPDADRMLKTYRQAVEDIQNMMAVGDVSKLKEAVMTASKRLF